jgi:hypothetical protein
MIDGCNSSIFRECLDDLKSKKLQLTATEYKWAKATIVAIQILQTKKIIFSSLNEEVYRNREISLRTGLLAEDGLIPGKNQSDLEKSIELRIELLKAAYVYDREKHETLLFFKKAFLGPPCFNGRIITLQEYVEKRQGSKAEIILRCVAHHLYCLQHGLKSDLYVQVKSDLDEQAARLEAFMYMCTEKEQKGIPSLEAVKKFAQNNLDLAIESGVCFENKNLQAVYYRACEFFVE